MNSLEEKIKAVIKLNVHLQRILLSPRPTSIIKLIQESCFIYDCKQQILLMPELNKNIPELHKVVSKFLFLEEKVSAKIWQDVGNN